MTIELLLRLKCLLIKGDSQFLVILIPHFSLYWVQAFYSRCPLHRDSAEILRFAAETCLLMSTTNRFISPSHGETVNGNTLSEMRPCQGQSRKVASCFIKHCPGFFWTKLFRIDLDSQSAIYFRRSFSTCNNWSTLWNWKHQEDDDDIKITISCLCHIGWEHPDQPR